METDGLSNGGSTQGKPIICKAAVAWGPGEPLVMEEVEVAPPERMEVRVKILFTSICHTDLSFWKGENELQRKFPRILGHEAAGVVESVGEGVEDLAPGDHVVPIFNGECGACAYCDSAVTNLCKTYRVNAFKSTMSGDNGTRFFVIDPSSGKRQPVYHFLNTSTFTEYTVLDSACAVKINPTAPLEKMCLVSCGISTVVAAVNTTMLEGLIHTRSIQSITPDKWTEGVYQLNSDFMQLPTISGGLFPASEPLTVTNYVVLEELDELGFTESADEMSMGNLNLGASTELADGALPSSSVVVVSAVTTAIQPVRGRGRARNVETTEVASLVRRLPRNNNAGFMHIALPA